MNPPCIQQKNKPNINKRVSDTLMSDFRLISLAFLSLSSEASLRSAPALFLLVLPLWHDL